MRILSCLVWFSLVAAVVCADDGSSDAVNERIHVTPEEMESHWQVDCANSWARAVELRKKADSPACAPPPNLLRQLKLCAFIYQPPGQQLTHFGPDYQSAAAQAADSVACLPETRGKRSLID